MRHFPIGLNLLLTLREILTPLAEADEDSDWVDVLMKTWVCAKSHLRMLTFDTARGRNDESYTMTSGPLSASAIFFSKLRVYPFSVHFPGRKCNPARCWSCARCRAAFYRATCEAHAAHFPRQQFCQRLLRDERHASGNFLTRARD